MTDRPARRVVETLLTIPWALSESMARRMLAIAQRRGTELQAIATERGQPLENNRKVTVREGVATIPVCGPLFRYADIFAEISGATSYEALARDLTAALKDPSVKAILLDVDSPGGEVFGASELSDLIYNARGEKPIVAHVGGMCCSAALWIASAADEIYASSVAILGSVGAMMSITVPDPERQAELFGEQEVEFISSQSPNKNLDPTSKAGREQYQAIVDKIAGVFGADLARNFGIKETQVFGSFGLGKVFVGTDAVEVGMAKRIATFEATHAALAERIQGGGLLFRRPAQAQPAATAVAVEQLFRALHLPGAIRPAAALRGLRVGALTDLVEALTVAPAAAAPAPASPPAPQADHQEDRRMPEPTAAAPTSGAQDPLVAFKARLAEITNLCVAAECPELASEYAQGDKSISAINVELMEKMKGKHRPQPMRAGDVRPGADREAEKPFASLGEQLQAIARVRPNVPESVDKRLLHISAAVSGAGAGVGGDGGFLIQKDFTTELFKEGFEAGALTSRCSVTPIGANADGLETIYIDETSRATGSRWGGIQIYRGAEADAATAKKPKIGKWECRLEDLIGAAYMTERLLQDAPAMESVFQEGFVDEFGFVGDDEVYRGTGVGMMMGVLNAACTVSVAKETGQPPDTIVAENVQKIWARVLPRSKARGIWVTNTECNPQLQNMQIGTGTSGHLVYMPPGGLSGSPFGAIFGRPVIEIEQASALGDVGDIAFLDLTQYKIITKGGIQADDSIHVRFLNNERTFRWIARVNGAPKLKSAITPYKGASGATLSPFVTLQARA